MIKFWGKVWTGHNVLTSSKMSPLCRPKHYASLVGTVYLQEHTHTPNSAQIGRLCCGIERSKSGSQWHSFFYKPVVDRRLYNIDPISAGMCSSFSGQMLPWFIYFFYFFTYEEMPVGLDFPSNFIELCLFNSLIRLNKTQGPRTAYAAQNQNCLLPY